MSRIQYLFAFVIVLSSCANSAPPKPKPGDWAERDIEGVRIDAPYALTTNPKPLPGWVNIASYMPATSPQAVEIRIDVIQQPAGKEEPTLDQFAQDLFITTDEKTNEPIKPTLTTAKIGDLEARKHSTQSKEKVYIDSIAFKKGKFFWLVEVFYSDKDLAPDAKRIIDSISVKKTQN